MSSARLSLAPASSLLGPNVSMRPVSTSMLAISVP
jgi:hypothetical protein